MSAINVYTVPLPIHIKFYAIGSAVIGSAVAQWIRLAAHGQWVVGSNPIRAVGGVRKGIRPQLLLCTKDKSVPRPAQKKSPIRVFLRVWRL